MFLGTYVCSGCSMEPICHAIPRWHSFLFGIIRFTITTFYFTGFKFNNVALSRAPPVFCEAPPAFYNSPPVLSLPHLSYPVPRQSCPLYHQSSATHHHSFLMHGQSSAMHQKITDGVTSKKLWVLIPYREKNRQKARLFLASRGIVCQSKTCMGIYLGHGGHRRPPCRPHRGSLL